MSSPETKELVNLAQAVPNDSLSNYLKERISCRRVTTRDREEGQTKLFSKFVPTSLHASY
jgi:hypothetical protein